MDGELDLPKLVKKDQQLNIKQAFLTESTK